MKDVGNRQNVWEEMQKGEVLKDIKIRKEEVERLKRQISCYLPFNEQEKADKERILEALNMDMLPSIFSRENPFAHMTASAWAVNQNRTKVLMVYHKIYQSWSWLGGHADGEANLLEVALREVKEESGITQVRPVSEQIYSLEVLTVDGHEKRGVYVSSHLHLNLTYLLEADEEEILHGREEENSGAAWFGLDEAVKASTEPWFQERIYRKLNKKL